MSALARYTKLQNKVSAIEAAGKAGNDEHRLAKAAMLEVTPLLSEPEKASLGLLETKEEGKVAESAGIDAGMGKITAGTGKGKKAKEPAPEKPKEIIAAVSNNEAKPDDTPAADN